MLMESEIMNEKKQKETQGMKFKILAIQKRKKEKKKMS